MKKLQSIGKSLSRKEQKSIIGGGYSYTGGWRGDRLGASCFLNMGCAVGTCVGPWFVSNPSDPYNASYIGHCA